MMRAVVISKLIVVFKSEEAKTKLKTLSNRAISEMANFSWFLLHIKLVLVQVKTNKIRSGVVINKPVEIKWLCEYHGSEGLLADKIIRLAIKTSIKNT